MEIAKDEEKKNFKVNNFFLPFANIFKFEIYIFFNQTNLNELNYALFINLK